MQYSQMLLQCDWTGYAALTISWEGEIQGVANRIVYLAIS